MKTHPLGRILREKLIYNQLIMNIIIIGFRVWILKYCIYQLEGYCKDVLRYNKEKDSTHGLHKKEFLTLPNRKLGRQSDAT